MRQRGWNGQLDRGSHCPHLQLGLSVVPTLSRSLETLQSPNIELMSLARFLSLLMKSLLPKGHLVSEDHLGAIPVVTDS